LEAQSRKATDDALYRQLAFQSGDGHACTRMGTGCKCQMGIRSALDVELVGLPEHFRIPIRRADAQMQIRAGRQQPFRKLHRLDDEPVTELIRALAAQNLLDRGIDEGGLRAQPLQLIFVSEQKIQRIPDEIRRRLVPGVQQKHAVVQQLGLSDWLFGTLLPDEAGEHTLVGVCQTPAALGDLRTQVCEEIGHCSIAPLLLLGAENGLKRAENRKRPLAQRAALSLGHAQQIPNDSGPNIMRQRLHLDRSGCDLRRV
jgi:hypothetical protein